MVIILKDQVVQRSKIVEWEVKEQIQQHHLVAKPQFCINQKKAPAVVEKSPSNFPFY